MSQQRQLLASMSHSGREKSDMSIGTFLRPIKDEEKGSSQISSKPGNLKRFLLLSKLNIRYPLKIPPGTYKRLNFDACR